MAHDSAAFGRRFLCDSQHVWSSYRSVSPSVHDLTVTARTILRVA
jgi:hypothetical protein